MCTRSIWILFFSSCTRFPFCTGFLNLLHDKSHHSPATSFRLTRRPSPHPTSTYNKTHILHTIQHRNKSRANRDGTQTAPLYHTKGEGAKKSRRRQQASVSTTLLLPSLIQPARPPPPAMSPTYTLSAHLCKQVCASWRQTRQTTTTTSSSTSTSTSAATHPPLSNVDALFLLRDRSPQSSASTAAAADDAAAKRSMDSQRSRRSSSSSSSSSAGRD